MKKPIDREAVLDAFALETHHDRTTLERYIKEFPELAEELVDLSFELRLSKMQDLEPSGSVVDPGLETAWKELLACEPQERAASQAVNPFAGLHGASLVALAKALHVPRSILMALRDGLVIPSSVPNRFMRRFADATGVEVASIRSYLDESRETPAALAFKSDLKPAHQGQATFRDFILNTQMADDQRHLLLGECDDDEHA